MLYLNSQQISNQDHIESMGMVISRLYCMGNLIYQRDITGTSGWLYEGTHTVNVGVGVSSVSITGNGGLGVENNYWVFSTPGYGGVKTYPFGTLFPSPNAVQTYEYGNYQGNNIFTGVIVGLPANINSIVGLGGYIACSGIDNGYMNPVYMAPISAGSAGGNTVITGAASHTFNGAAFGVTTAPNETTVTKAVDPYIVKTFNVTVPVGGKCKLDW